MKYRVLHTSRLTLESAGIEDQNIREMVGWLNDPITMQYSEQRHVRHTIDSQRNYILLYRGENLLLLIRQNKRVIGTLSIMVDEPNNIADVGILIGDRACWGKGFGLEAWKAACDLKFADGIRKIEAGCMADNISMMSICQRYDMMEEGRRDHHFLHNGLPVDLVHWGKFK